MKQTTNGRRLRLNKTTISRLDESAQGSVLGGAGASKLSPTTTVMRIQPTTSIFNCTTNTSCGLFYCNTTTIMQTL
jgi:hypothetical protein